MKKNYIEIWDDLVRLSDLVKALVICISLTLLGYFIAPGEYPNPLFFGLGGAIIGFIVSSFLIEPKRIVKEGDEK